MPAPIDREAVRERADYLEQRYGAPPDRVQEIVTSMDIPTQVFLAIEMRAHERRGFTSDYDPLGML
jgi:hypothetical protein